MEPAVLDQKVLEIAPAPAVLPVLAPPTEEELRLIVYRSVTRWALLLLATIVFAIGVVPLIPKVLDHGDLAKGRPWRASSVFAVCDPEKITCGSGRTAVFFHTVEESQPWLEIDLGAPTRFSEVVVVNRRDGGQDVLDRAVPLILEVSDDQKTWRTLGQVDKSFSVWKPKFEATTARYVRTRSPRTTMLHLDAVKIYP